MQIYDTPPRTAFPPPFAVPLPQPDRAQLRRRAGRTFRSAGRHFTPLLWARMRGEAAEESAVARALRLTFEDLGATYLKFGQLVGSAPGVFGDTVAAEFRTCLDTGPSVDFDHVRAAVECELGRRLEDAFAEFSVVPLAAASIAVVHDARLHDGRRVAVKVLRPGINTLVASDLELMQPLLDLLARQIGVGVAGPLLQLLAGFREQVAEELDLRNETRTMIHNRRLLATLDLPLITIPEPVPEYCGRTVLTMEYLDGVPIDDLAAIAETGVDPKPLVEAVVKGWFMTTVRDGIFHGDVHAGNLMLLRDGRMGVIDWGILGRLDADTHAFFRNIIRASLGDHAAWDAVGDHIVNVYGAAVQEGLGMTRAEIRQWVRGMIEPMLTRPFGAATRAHMPLATPGEVARAEGEKAEKRSLWAVVKRWRELRKVRSAADVGFGGNFDRGFFLLGKQLMYFERYGKMFLSDVALISDRQFFEDLLVAPPIDPEGPLHIR